MIPLKDNIPTRRFPVLTVALIAINVFVFVFLQHGGHAGFGAPNENNLVRWTFSEFSDERVRWIEDEVEELERWDGLE